MQLPIYVYGSQVLRTVAKDVDLNNKEEILKLIADMKETMAAADGCGLAAPQVGHSKRILLVDGTDLTDSFPELADFRRTMINPRVIEFSEEKCSFSEGCLSIPGIYADVVRPKDVLVEYYDENFEKKEERFTGFASRMVQHEISHLEGDLFVDRVSAIRKKMIAKKLANIQAGKVSARYKIKLEK